MSVLKRWTGTEWEVLGLGVSADVSDLSAVTTVNGKVGVVTLNAGDIPYSSSGSYSNNTVGKTIQNLNTYATPLIATSDTPFATIMAALNGGRTVYADIDNLRHNFLFRGIVDTNILGIMFAAVTNGSISIVTYRTTGGMTRTVTNIGDTNYWATFGTTTNAEINTAINNNKTIKCQIANLTYDLNYNDSSENIAFFTSTIRENGNLIIYWLQVSSDSWTSGSMSTSATAGTVTLGTNWAGSGPFSQAASTTYTATEKTVVEIRPGVEIINQLANDGVSQLLIENNAGTLTAYATGAKPSAALTLPVLFFEVI